ncbi:hypothetical protein MLD38_008431 [Melastoma candidum]|uniref:Uncharacterized protein n=1 Tax=Melastoma candidum TaxID=119954 RepID=A0ACB9RTR6_9MYRT|nr:hypothetical protein MLD38_008431 [Melastoma candidum]
MIWGCRFSLLSPFAAPTNCQLYITDMCKAGLAGLYNLPTHPPTHLLTETQLLLYMFDKGQERRGGGILHLPGNKLMIMIMINATLTFYLLSFHPQFHLMNEICG